MKERRVLRFDLEGERGSMRRERERREGEVKSWSRLPRMGSRYAEATSAKVLGRRTKHANQLLCPRSLPCTRFNQTRTGNYNYPKDL